MAKKDKKLLIVGNSKSIHTKNLKELIKDYFLEVYITKGIDYSFRNPLNIIRAIKQSKNLLKSYKPDFIILYQVDTAAFIFTLLNKKRIKTLVVSIGSDVLINSNKGLLYKFLIKYVINRGDFFNAGSFAIRDKMKEMANKDIDVVIANLGVEKTEEREKQDIIYSNRLHKPVYHLDKIIEAFFLFQQNKERKSWRLVVAATGEEDILKKRVKELGVEDKVYFVGWLDKEKNQYYYSISKIWVSLPESDSISISLMEAMNNGCLPVVYDVPAIRGFIENKKNGIVVKDLNSNFLEDVFALDIDDAVKKNKELVEEFGDKEKNKQKFYGIFDKAFN